MSQDLDMQHFGDPSEPGAPGHQAWLREQRGKEGAMGSLTGDGARKELRGAAAAEESTQVDPLADDVSRETARATRLERRSAYLGGVMDKHHPDL